MNAWLTLADFAQVHAGKLNIVGGAISMLGPGPVAMAVAIQINVDWADRSKRKHLRVSLYDADDKPVSLPTPLGDVPVEVAADYEVAPPPGSPQATELPFAFAFHVAGVPLPPGSYKWLLYLDNAETHAAKVSFAVR